VFPRRLFSQNHIFVNAQAGIETPQDLIGKRVILRTFQTTMSVLALGDLKFEYGVPWDKVRWIVADDEVMPLGDEKGIEVERIGLDEDVGRMLVDGEARAVVFNIKGINRIGITALDLAGVHADATARNQHPRPFQPRPFGDHLQAPFLARPPNITRLATKSRQIGKGHCP